MENLVTLKGARIVRNSGVYSITIPSTFIKNEIINTNKLHDITIKETKVNKQ